MSDQVTTTDGAELERVIQLADKRVLDVGCGTGGLVRRLRELGAQPSGAECTPPQLSEALRLDPDHVEDYVDAGAQELPFPDDAFDVVTFIYSLHHVPGDLHGAAMAEVARVLRPGGTLWVAEPIAAGPGHQVDRVVDDETEVRAHAQVTLNEVSSHGLVEQDSAHYLTQYVYADFAAWESSMAGVDPTRAARLDAHRDEAQALFDEHGTPHPDGVSFHQPALWRRFESQPG